MILKAIETASTAFSQEVWVVSEKANFIYLFTSCH